MTIKIDKGIPIPDPGNVKFPWYDMKVGDSFFSRREDTRSIIQAPPKLIKEGWFFKQNKVKGGVRVWRTK